MPYLTPRFELGRTHSVTRKVTFMQAVEFGLGDFDETGVVFGWHALKFAANQKSRRFFIQHLTDDPLIRRTAFDRLKEASTQTPGQAIVTVFNAGYRGDGLRAERSP